MLNNISAYAHSRSWNDIAIDVLHVAGVVFFVGLVWVMFCGYIITPPVWWHV